MDDIITQIKKLDINDDISKNKEFNKNYNNSIVKKWIKQISIKDTISFDNYNRKNNFKLVADILLDNDINTKTNKKKRKTLIKFSPKISLDEYNKKSEWLYIFTINDRIVKIGGSRTGIYGRASSYLCGRSLKYLMLALNILKTLFY